MYNVIRAMKQTMTWAGHVARMKVIKDSETSKWERVILAKYDTKCAVDWAEERLQWWASENMKAWNFLPSRVTTNLKTLYYEVSSTA
jgi:hypothetical protein